MKALLPIAFASIAAIGNALFALGQKQSAGVPNRLVFVALSAFVATSLAVIASSFQGHITLAPILKSHGRSVMLSGVGLFLTYLGFNLLYSRFGASQYVVYAALSIVTTTIGVGFLYMREPINAYHIAAVVVSLAAIALFAIA